MGVGVLRVLEGEDLVDDGAQAGGLDEPVHGNEHGARADIGAGKRDRLGDQGHRTDGAARLIEYADQRHDPARTHRVQRARQGAGAADLDDGIDAHAARQLQHFGVPVRRRTIVDRVRRAEIAGALQFIFRRRGGDDGETRGGRELQREDRHAARAEREHGLAGTRPRDLEQSVPGGDRRARKRRRFLEAQMRRDADNAIGRQHDLFGEHALNRAAEVGAEDVGAERAVLPALEEDARDTVTDLPIADARAYGDDFASAIRQRHGIDLDGAEEILAGGDAEIAIVGRARLHRDLHLAGTRLRRGRLDQTETCCACGRTRGDNPLAHDFSPSTR